VPHRCFKVWFLPDSTFNGQGFRFASVLERSRSLNPPSRRAQFNVQSAGMLRAANVAVRFFPFGEALGSEPSRPMRMAADFIHTPGVALSATTAATVSQE